MIIARGLRFSVRIKHCPKKERITCLVPTFCSSVFSELMDTDRTVERASWPVLSWTLELRLHEMLSVCTPLFRAVWAKKYKHHKRYTLCAQTHVKCLTCITSSLPTFAHSGRGGQEYYLHFMDEEMEAKEAKQVLQVCMIKTKETELGFDPRSILFRGQCF